MNTAACKGIQEHWQCCHKGLTFTGRHLSDLTLMQNRTTNELNIVVHHVPHGLITSSFPMIVVDGFIALNVEEVVAIGSKFTVKIGCCHLDCLILGEAFGSLLNDSKYRGQHLVELILDAVENFFLNLVNFSPQWFAIFILESLDFSLNRCNLVALWFYILFNLLFDCGTAGTQFIVRQLLYLGIRFLYLTNDGHELLQVTLTLVAEDRLQKTIK